MTTSNNDDISQAAQAKAATFPNGVNAIIVAGISGSGKSTLATSLANSLNCAFIEADDHHSESSKAKMAAGTPLTDEDRAPWIQHLNTLLKEQQPAVLACSALKHIYRDALSEGLKIRFIWLNISKELAEERVASRANHFMPANLVTSQLATAEIPDDALRLDAGDTPEVLLEQAIQFIKNA